MLSDARKCILWASFFLAAMTSFANGQEKTPSYIGYRDLLGLVNFVIVDLSDQVSGNCWTNSDKIAANAKLKFEQNGIEIVDYKPKYSKINAPIVRLRLVGFRAGGLCTGHAELSVLSYLVQKYTASTSDSEFLLVGSTILFDKSAIYSRGSNLNEQAEDFFDAGISELLLQIIKSKRHEAVSRLLAEDELIGEKPPAE